MFSVEFVQTELIGNFAVSGVLNVLKQAGKDVGPTGQNCTWKFRGTSAKLLLSLDFLGPIGFVAATWQIGRRRLWSKEI